MKVLRKYTERIPARVVLGLLLFLASVITFCHQINLNLALVAMVNRTEASDTVPSTLTSCYTVRNPEGNKTRQGSQSEGGEFQWSPATQGLVLGSLYYGIISTHGAGGLLVQRFSPRLIGLVSVFGSSLLGLLIPFLARTGGALALILLRAFQGALLGVFMPVLYALVAQWSPLSERTVLVSLSHVGCVLGAAITVVSTGYIVAYGFLGGWPAVFYVTGSVGCIFCVAWYFLLYDRPEDHPTISPDELIYITKSTETVTPDRRKGVPWMSVVKSVPFWSLLVVRFTGTWSFSTLTTATPIYLHSALHLPMDKNGLVNGLLFVASVVSSLFSGILADVLRRKTNLSITTIRKTMSGIAYCTGSMCWFLVTSAGCDAGAAVTIIISTKLLTCLNIGGDYATVVDMAPRFAGPLSGILYTFSDLTGILSPMLTGFLTNEDVSLDRWHLVFCAAAGIQLFGLAQFLVLGSAELQPWAKSQDDSEMIKKVVREVTESRPLINEGKRLYDTLTVSSETS